MSALRALAALLLVVLGAAQAAPSNEATQRALDALFSLAEFQPEGAELSPAPPGFEHEQTGEKELIAYLAEQKRQGADLNAYRHRGTPLHHAIRVGWDATARWLLTQGANPLLRTDAESEAGRAPDQPPGPDAVGLAVRHGRWALLPTLRAHPQLRALTPVQLAQATWPYLVDQPAHAAAWLAQGAPLPDPATQAPLANALLQSALCSAQRPLAQALLKGAAPVTYAPTRAWDWACAASAQWKAPQAAELAAWVPIEAQLGQPLRSLWLGQMAALGPAQALLQAPGLQAPWATPQGMKVLLWEVVRRDATLAPQLLRLIPPATLRGALLGPDALIHWLQASGRWNAVDAAWALQQLDRAALQAQQADAVTAWEGAVGYERARTHWPLLTELLRAPLRLKPDSQPLNSVPLALWPRWFALGYEPPDAWWPRWLGRVDLPELEASWRLLAQRRPALARQALAWLVAPLSVGSSDDPLLRSLSYVGHADLPGAALERARFLHAQGLKVDKPRWLAAAFKGSEDPLVVHALAQGWVREPTPEQRQQLELAPADCTGLPPAALLTSLRGGQPAAGASVFAMRRPDGRCAWLASSGENGGRRDFDDSSFEGGQRVMRPCTDGDHGLWQWAPAPGAWQDVPWNVEPGLEPIDPMVVRMRQQPALQALMSIEESQGTCGTRAGSLWRPVWQGEQLSLQVLKPGEALFDALALQCPFTAVSECLEASPEPQGHTAEAFVTRHGAAQKAEWLRALNALDRPALKSQQQQGLFGSWLDEGLAQLAAQNLPLAAKRQRAAWVLAQRQPAPALTLPTVDSLLTWLPAEDWPTIARLLACGNSAVLSELLTRERVRQEPALATRLQREQQRGCGRAS